MDFSSFLGAAGIVFSPLGLLVNFMGVLFGILAGAMPGLSAIMAITLILPLSFSLDGLYGILMILGVFCGAIYGGSITAILINTPGTANSAATCLDGYPMAYTLKQPGRALSISTTASTFGGLLSAIALLFTAPLLAKVALSFGVSEYFALGIFGLSIVTGVSSKSIKKGLLGAMLGLLLGTVGMDSTSATMRYTFGTTYLIGGIAFVPMLIGLYALSQCLITAEESLKGSAQRTKIKLTQILPTRKDFKLCLPTFLRSSILGTLIGAIPGTGGDIACWVGYNEAKRFSKHPEEFGHGAPEGIAAPEAANNAVSGGALIPLLTLGIPGDAGTAIMLGALMMQGITPGPLLFTTQTEKVYVIIIGLFLANVIMCLLGFSGIKLFSKISSVPMKWLTPIVFMFCVVGTYALNNNMNDIYLMLIAGILAYFLIKMDFPMPPVILGLILSGTVENNLRRTIVLADGKFFSFILHRPIALILLLIAIVSLFYPIFISFYQKKKDKEKTVAQNSDL
ncbi:MAG: tripartite tricarboxylate transporter permease [Oscillospiraceae bacterium]